MTEQDPHEIKPVNILSWMAVGMTKLYPLVSVLKKMALKASGTIKRLGLVGVGVLLLEEVCNFAGRL